MHPRTDEILAHLDAHRAMLERAVTSVPEAERGQRPGEGRWSSAEVLEHLAIVEGSIMRLLRAKIDEARAAGLALETDSAPVVPTVPTRRLLDRSAKITAGERSLPTGSVDWKEGLRRLAESRLALTQLVRESDGLALGEIVVPHGVLGPINVYQWLVFVGSHEGRHALQIEELAGLTRN